MWASKSFKVCSSIKVLLIVLVSIAGRTEGNSSFPEFPHQFEPDYSGLNRNATRCSTTNLSFEKESLLHTWELTGILKYLTYLQRFDQSFEVKTEDVNFKSENVDGAWIFRLSKMSAQILQTRTLVGGDDVGAAGQQQQQQQQQQQDPSPMKISSSYSYEATTPKRINFGIYLTIIHDNRELVLPLQTSSEPTITQQRTYTTARANALPIFTFTHSFSWPDVHEEFNSILGGGGGSSEGSSSQYNNNNARDDLSLRFLIMAYYPNDPKFSQNNENCNEELLSEMSSAASPSSTLKQTFGNNNNGARPPFIKHTNSMLNDDKYTDLYLRVGNEDFPAHRIILATTSPVFSALIYNETVFNLNSLEGAHNSNTINENISSSDPAGPFPTLLLPTIIQIDDDITPETVQEMLRYIYTGKVESLVDLSGQLLVAAERYGLPELKRSCEKIIVGQIKLENAIEMYILGMQVNSNKLTKKAFSIMRANKTKIVSQFEEFRKLSTQYPSLMFELFVS